MFVQCIMYNVYCIMNSVRLALYNHYCTMYIVYKHIHVYKHILYTSILYTSILYTSIHNQNLFYNKIFFKINDKYISEYKNNLI